MDNLFCLMKDIVSRRGVGNMYLDDGTPFVKSQYFIITCMPKWLIRLMFRVHVASYTASCIRDTVWFDIYLGEEYGYPLIQIYFKK